MSHLHYISIATFQTLAGLAWLCIILEMHFVTFLTQNSSNFNSRYDVVAELYSSYQKICHSCWS